MGQTLFHYRSANVTVQTSGVQTSARIRSILSDVSHCFHLVIPRYIHRTPPYIRAQWCPFCMLCPNFGIYHPKIRSCKDLHTVSVVKQAMNKYKINSSDVILVALGIDHSQQ